MPVSAALADVRTFTTKVAAISQTGEKVVAVWLKTMCRSDRPLDAAYFTAGNDDQALGFSGRADCARTVRVLAPGTIWRYKLPRITVDARQVNGRWSQRSTPATWMNRAGEKTAPPENAARIANARALVVGIREFERPGDGVPVAAVNLRVRCGGEAARYEFDFPGHATVTRSTCDHTWRLILEGLRARDVEARYLAWATITAHGARGDQVSARARLAQ